MSSREFNSALLAWFREVKRPLPWRDTTDPYIHWVSEIMLQQTQVATVLPYFMRWMGVFPTVKTLAEADLEAVLAVWSGLGYYRRARLLHEGARYIAEHGWPKCASEWRRVPGVGAYTAGAIASMTCFEPVPAVDGNVQRVFARLTCRPLTGSSLLAATTAWAESVLDQERPGEWNEAMMEVGATVCRPRNPECPRCPLRQFCAAFASSRQSEFPVRPLRAEKLELEFLVWVPYYAGKLGMLQISEGPWWRGLWEFPRASCGFDAEAALAKVVGHPLSVKRLGTLKTTVTNHRLILHASLVLAESPSPHLEWFSPESSLSLPLPSAQLKLIGIVSSALRTGTRVDSVPDCSP